MKISTASCEELPELSLGGAMLILGGCQQILGRNRGGNLGLGLVTVLVAP